MKKIIAAVLCAVLTFASVASISAANQTDSSSSYPVYNYKYKIIGEDTIPDNYARFYTFGTNSDTTSGIIITDRATSSSVTHYFSFGSEPVNMYLPSTSGYECFYTLANGQINTNRDLCLNETGGTYEKIRIKLSAFSDYFNSDGTHTKDAPDGPHKFNFTREYIGDSPYLFYSSQLVFVSGGAITAVAPDCNGMAEIYVSTKLGEETRYIVNYYSKTSATITSTGGGTTGAILCGFTMGDVDKNKYVNVADATLIQKYLVGSATLDSLAKRNADADRDGKISVLDATAIQKYLAGII